LENYSALYVGSPGHAHWKTIVHYTWAHLDTPIGKPYREAGYIREGVPIRPVVPFNGHDGDAPPREVSNSVQSDGTDAHPLVVVHEYGPVQGAEDEHAAVGRPFDEAELDQTRCDGGEVLV
jgi:hypothetical protein